MHVFVSMSVLFAGCFILYDVSKQVYVSKIVEGKELDSIRTFQSDKPVISFSSFYSPLMNVSPFSNTRENLKIWSSIIPFGTTIGSPDFDQNLKNRGLSQDLFGSVLSGSAYLGVTNVSEKNLVTEYLREHYKVNVGFTQILKTKEDLFGRKFQILKIHTA
jgi:hypothetical protein